MAKNRERAIENGFIMIFGKNMNFLTNTLSAHTPLRVHCGGRFLLLLPLLRFASRLLRTGNVTTIRCVSIRTGGASTFFSIFEVPQSTLLCPHPAQTVTYLHSLSYAAGNPAEGVVQHQRRVLRTHQRIAKTLGLVSCAFLFCWLPFFTLYMLSA